MESVLIKRGTAVLAALAAASLFLSGCAQDNSRTESDKSNRSEKKDDKSDKKEDSKNAPDETGDPFQEPEDQNVFDIKVGDCITDTDADGQVQSVPTVACSQPHSYEVFHEFELTGSKFPGDDGILPDVQRECYGKPFEEFIGRPYDKSSLEVMYLSPTQMSWDGGDRLVSCMVYEGDGTGNPTTGSLEGSNL